MEKAPRRKSVRKNEDEEEPKVVRRVKSAPVKSNPKAVTAAKDSKKPSINSARRRKVEVDQPITLLSGSPSLRLLEKTRIYHDWYERHSPAFFTRLAQVSGYIFVIFGAVSLFALLLVSTPGLRGAVASTICATGTICTTDTLTTTDPTATESTLTPTTTSEPTPTTTTVEYPRAEVKFLNSPVVTIGTDTLVKIEVLNARSHVFGFQSKATGQMQHLTAGKREGEVVYIYSFPASTLAPGDYRVYVQTVGLDPAGTKANFYGPSIRVPEPVSTSDTGTSESTSGSGTVNTTSSGTVSTTESNSGTGTSALDTSISGSTLSTEGTVSTTTLTDPSKVITDTKTSSTTTIASPVSTASTTPSTDLEMRLEKTTDPTRMRVVLRPIYNYERVELYIRLENSTVLQYLGIPMKATEGLLYWLNATQIPNGRHRIIARAFDKGELRAKAEVLFENNQPTAKVEVVETKEREIIELASGLTAPKTEEASLDPNKSTQLDTASTLSTTTPVPPPDNQNLFVGFKRGGESALLLPPDPTQATTVVPEQRKEAKKLIMENDDSFNELFDRYASAVQSGDEDMLRLADKKIKEKVDLILLDKIMSNRGSESAGELEEHILAEVEEVKQRVEKVEKILKERTGEKSSVDTDRDGISDFDEVTLYKTDLNIPDTDGDGVTDGIEIMGGYNPKDAKPEAIIRFDSPKEVPYANDKVLKIESVQPVLEYEADTPAPAVQSEIKGFALPNSFVTLYIFSAPTVVTIKTNDDGSFSYVFTKELEDGEHEVYVALTDNAGDIVVRSSPFRFVKTAQAFTYVDAETDVPASVVGATAADDDFIILNIIGAMGIVSFGLILLLLGLTLRHKRPETLDSAVSA